MLAAERPGRTVRSTLGTRGGAFRACPASHVRTGSLLQPRTPNTANRLPRHDAETAGAPRVGGVRLCEVHLPLGQRRPRGKVSVLRRLPVGNGRKHLPRPAASEGGTVTEGGGSEGGTTGQCGEVCR